MNKESTTEMLRAVPGAGVGGAVIFGYPLEAWALALTILYYAFLLFALLRDKYWDHYKRKRDERQAD